MGGVLRDDSLELLLEGFYAGATLRNSPCSKTTLNTRDDFTPFGNSLVNCGAHSLIASSDFA